jgi:hypothetical protein
MAHVLGRYKKALMITAAILVVLIISLLLAVKHYVEPVLRDRLRVFIVHGSDSLYTYNLGGLKASFFGGSVEVHDLRVQVDSARFKVLQQRSALPPLTLELELKKGRIRGIGVIPLLFGKKIKIKEILSQEADIRISRHLSGDTNVMTQVPLWKAIQPDISRIEVNRINLDGVKLLYRHADTARSVKLQFDRCEAKFDDVVIDSASTHDVSRLGFSKEMWFRFHDLKFRSPDSTLKMKAEWITYSSRSGTLDIDSFKMQPTLEEKEDFYKAVRTQTSMNVIMLDKTRLVNFRLDKFLRKDMLHADSLVFRNPEFSVFIDRTMPGEYRNRVGQFPHQRLLKSLFHINIAHVRAIGLKLQYIESFREKGETTVQLDNIGLTAANLTNDSQAIRKNRFCTVDLRGTILGSSPVETSFRFYLDSANGRFDASGRVRNVNASQLNALSPAASPMKVQSVAIEEVAFRLQGEDFGAKGEVRMRYNNLAVVMQKVNEKTGAVTPSGFMTKVINKHVLWPQNPGPGGVERTSPDTRFSRMTTVPFFGMLWKTIMAGMQNIMTKSAA